MIHCSIPQMQPIPDLSAKITAFFEIVRLRVPKWVLTDDRRQSLVDHVLSLSLGLCMRVADDRFTSLHALDAYRTALCTSLAALGDFGTDSELNLGRSLLWEINRVRSHFPFKEYPGLYVAGAPLARNRHKGTSEKLATEWPS